MLAPTQAHRLFEVSDAAKQRLVELGYEPALKARPLKRTIVKELQDPLAQALLSAKLPAGMSSRSTSAATLCRWKRWRAERPLLREPASLEAGEAALGAAAVREAIQQLVIPTELLRHWRRDFVGVRCQSRRTLEHAGRSRGLDAQRRQRKRHDTRPVRAACAHNRRATKLTNGRQLAIARMPPVIARVEARTTRRRRADCPCRAAFLAACPVAFHPARPCSWRPASCPSCRPSFLSGTSSLQPSPNRRPSC